MDARCDEPLKLLAIEHGINPCDTPSDIASRSRGIVSKGVCEPVDRLTLFGGTFSPAVLAKATHYKHIVLLCGNKWTLKRFLPTFGDVTFWNIM